MHIIFQESKKNEKESEMKVLLTEIPSKHTCRPYTVICVIIFFYHSYSLKYSMSPLRDTGEGSKY